MTVIDLQAAKYAVPRWFLASIIERESSFDAQAVNPNDGGQGLCQLTLPWSAGQPYPYNLERPDDAYQKWAWDMGFEKYGPWMAMSNVSRLDDPFSGTQNVERFISGFARPAYRLYSRLYHVKGVHAWRIVAWAWNQGVFRLYDPLSTKYLPLYDTLATKYRTASSPGEFADGSSIVD